jgi:hypothetical protein
VIVNAEKNQPEARRVIGKPFTGASDPRSNRGGRPRGTTNRKSAVLYALLEPHGPQLLEKALQMATGDNPDAVILKDLLAKLLPSAPRSLPIKFALPHGTPAEQGAAVLAAAADGHVSLEDATHLVGIIERVVRVVEATEVVERLARIEAQLSQGAR